MNKNILVPPDVVKKEAKKVNIVPKNETTDMLSPSLLQRSYTKENSQKKNKISLLNYSQKKDVLYKTSSHHPIILKNELLINKNKIKKCIILSEVLRKKY